jgi:hypothetical protein
LKVLNNYSIINYLQIIMPPIILIEYDEYDIEKTDNEQLFINIVICIIWIAYIYEVCMFINRTFIRR